MIRAASRVSAYGMAGRSNNNFFLMEFSGTSIAARRQDRLVHHLAHP